MLADLVVEFDELGGIRFALAPVRPNAGLAG